MKEQNERFLKYFLLFYMFFSVMIFWANRNYEFLYYTLILSIIMYFAIIHRKKFMLSNYLVGGFILYLILHTLGADTYIFGITVFDIWLIPKVIRYDQLVHMYGGFLIAILTSTVLSQFIIDKFKNTKIFYITIVLISMGIAALWEITELGAVLFLSLTGVGDYLNNSFDLLFNMIGSSIGALLIYNINKRR